jgi:broad specificity phosphatase PhoE
MSQEIYVIRHCESQANVDLSTHFRMTNADVELTPEGELQNEQVAVELIGSWDRSRRASYKVLFSSPFKRTRRMVDVLASKMKEKKISYSRYEDILLSEQNWGHAIGHNEMDLYLQQESCSLPFDRQK